MLPPPDALLLRKRFTVRAGLAMTLIFLLALSGSLSNYADAVAPAERDQTIGALYDTLAPALEILHRYGGYLLLILLPSCGIPLLRLRTQLKTRDGAILGAFGMIIIALGIVVPAAALLTGHSAMSVRQTTETPLDTDLPVDGSMSWHLSWAPLALAAVTLLILLAAFRLSRAVPKVAKGNGAASSGSAML